MAEPVHSRINELMTLHEFMANANIKSGSNQAETIMNMWVENQMPHTKQYPHNTPMWGGDIGRAFFTSSNNFPVEPDTLHVKKGDMHDWIAELTHAVQYNSPQSVRDSLRTTLNKQRKHFGEDVYGLKREGEKYYPTSVVNWPEWGGEHTLFELYDKVNEEGYPNPKGKYPTDIPIEFQAHSVIQPLLEKRFYDAKHRDLLETNPLEHNIIEWLKKFLPSQKDVSSSGKGTTIKIARPK
jgi:hypothetical protein